MSNVMTHSPANNSGVWLQFENYCRDLVQTNPPHHLLGLLANQR
jgi:DNA/RNA endonuclease G (NUC1)